jgi:hypothetical protein
VSTRLRIQFEPGASHQAIVAAIRQLSGHVVDGPDSDGAYLVELGAVPAAALATRLRQLQQQPGLVHTVELVP